MPFNLGIGYQSALRLAYVKIVVLIDDKRAGTSKLLPFGHEFAIRRKDVNAALMEATEVGFAPFMLTRPSAPRIHKCLLLLFALNVYRVVGYRFRGGLP